MSSYPILDNRPIDQWKVVELKEELKRRKLTTKGLKDDLIKRLDEAIRVERENAEKEMQEDSGNDSGAQGEAKTDNEEYVSQCEKELDKANDNDEKIDDAGVKIDINGTVDPPVQEDESAGVSDVEKLEENVSTAIVEDTGNVVCEVPLSWQENPEKLENGDPEIQPENGDLKCQVESDDVKPPQEDAILGSASPNNQVSEVSPNLGFQVKSDSISSDSLSINEKNEFKDNITADNVKLELDVVKPEMVQPSSSNVVPVDGKSHPMNVEEPHENKVAVEDKEDDLSMKEVENKNNETTDIGYPEKLNLEPTSGEDTMEEDVPEKHVKSKHDGAEGSDRNEKNEITVVRGESPVLVVGDVEKKDYEVNQPTTIAEERKPNDVVYPEKLNLDETSGDDTMKEDVPEKHVKSKHDGVEVSGRNKKSEMTVVKEENSVLVVGDDEKKDIKVKQPTTFSDKRKLNDQGGNGSNEPIKRQRKWKTESLKVPEAQGSSVSPLTSPKETLPTSTLRRSFSRSDSTASDNDATKERVVPPSQKPLTNSLRIDQFLRPFTLKAVEELLGKTGAVKSLWMDHIKTHCYVTYSSVEEAEATRNAVHNLKWPRYGGRLLVADFVDPQEVKYRVEAPKSAAPTTAAASTTTGPAAAFTKPATKPQLPLPRHLAAAPPKQQQLPPPPPPSREREGLHHLPPPPPLPEKAEPTILTLDVLFKKTKATPRIYYLPLSEEQVAAKLKGRGRPTTRPS